MNDTPSEPGPIESAPLPMPYKDRSTGLVVFGILTIVMGCIAALFVPLMLFGQAAAAKASNMPGNFSTMLPVVFFYGILAVALVWLGIGSIMARRWARALLLIFSWSWLVIGLFTLLLMGFFVPQTLANMSSAGTAGRPALPSAAMGAVMMVMFLTLGVFFVILPGVWAFFYNSRHVIATCEARDPVTRWTNSCPLPVLAICLWSLISAPMMLLMPVTGHGVMPFFGMFLTGAPGALFCLAIAVIWGYAAWSLYKLEQRGWWIFLAAICAMMASSLLTFARHDMLEMYHLMGYPEAQIEELQKAGFLTGNRMVWMMSLGMLPFLGYLLFIRKFLRRQS